MPLRRAVATLKPPSSRVWGPPLASPDWAIELGLGQLAAHLHRFLLGGLELGLKLHDPVRQLLQAGVEAARCPARRREAFAGPAHGQLTGQRFDAPHARRHVLVPDDHERADVAGALHVCAAAEFASW